MCQSVRVGHICFFSPFRDEHLWGSGALNRLRTLRKSLRKCFVLLWLSTHIMHSGKCNHDFHVRHCYDSFTREIDPVSLCATATHMDFEKDHLCMWSFVLYFQNSQVICVAICVVDHCNCQGGYHVLGQGTECICLFCRINLVLVRIFVDFHYVLPAASVLVQSM